VSPHAGKANVGAERTVASALDDRARGFAQNREVSLEQLRMRGRETPETVEGAVDLLVVVPDPRHVDGGLAQLGREFERDGNAALHVDGSATNEVLDAVNHLGA